MTDKLQKVRAEVERLMNELITERKKGFGSDVDDACILELNNVLSYIKFVQEESVSKPIDFEKELYKAFGQVKDFTLGMRIAKWFYDIGKNSQEPVSEDLGEYINELSKQFPEVSFAKLSRIAIRVAKWQKEHNKL